MNRVLLVIIVSFVILNLNADDSKKEAVPSVKKEKKEVHIEASKNEPVEIKGDKAEFNMKKEEATYIGNVVLVHGDITLTCDRLQAFGSQKEKVIGYGNVKWLRKKDNTSLTCNYFQYEKNTKYMLAREKPVLTMIDKNKEKTVIVAEEMELFGEKNEAIGIKNVVITKEDTKATCQKAHYFDEDGKLILTGSPVVEQNKNVFKGDTITVYLEEGKIILENNVNTVIYPDTIPDKSKEDNSGQKKKEK